MRIMGLFGCLVFLWFPVFAEPYYAAWTGLSCYGCHVNQTGGGPRNAYGKAWGEALQTFPWKALSKEVRGFSSGEAGSIDFSGDLQSFWTADDHGSRFEDGRQTLSVIAYVNESVRAVYTQSFSAVDVGERYVLVRGLPLGAFLKAGTFYIPYGLTLSDEESLIRAPSGFSFNRRDEGVEVGVLPEFLDHRFFLTTARTQGASDHPKTLSSWGTFSFGPHGTIGGSCFRAEEVTGRKNRYSVFGWGKIRRIVALGEYLFGMDRDLSEKETKSSAAHGSVEIHLGRNIYLRGVQEFRNPSRSIALDEHYRTVVSLRMFPVSALEWQVDLAQITPRIGVKEKKAKTQLGVFF